ncbi:hypothetical protein QLX08_004772 [Tetragonisca angustula]|uniref:Uncharacterized protein n=1 Tax=Tetragonisca angustula TaxID=166442 RepID=A0AAW1A3Q3_9HYME
MAWNNRWLALPVRNNERSEPFPVANDWNWLEITERKNNEGGGEGIRKRSERSTAAADVEILHWSSFYPSFYAVEWPNRRRDCRSGRQPGF